MEPTCFFLYNLHTGFSEGKKEFGDRKRRRLAKLLLNIGLQRLHEGTAQPNGARPTPSFMEIDPEALMLGPRFFSFMMEVERLNSFM